MLRYVTLEQGDAMEHVLRRLVGFENLSGARSQRYGKNFRRDVRIHRRVTILPQQQVTIERLSERDDAAAGFVEHGLPLAADGLREEFLQPRGLDAAGDAHQRLARLAAFIAT